MKLKVIQNLEESDTFILQDFSLQIEHVYFPKFNLEGIRQFKYISSVYSCKSTKHNYYQVKKRNPENIIINQKEYKINGIVFDYELALQLKIEKANELKAKIKSYEQFKNVIKEKAVETIFKAFGVNDYCKYERYGISYILKKERVIFDVISIHRPSVIPETFKKTHAFDISARKYVLFKEYF